MIVLTQHGILGLAISVTPAKAGVHAQSYYWMPAEAGMTILRITMRGRVRTVNECYRLTTWCWLHLSRCHQLMR